MIADRLGAHLYKFPAELYIIMCVQTVFFIPAGPSNLGMQTTLSENMEDDMERVSLAKELSSTTYPGRGKKELEEKMTQLSAAKTLAEVS